MFRHIVLYKLKDRSNESKRALQEKFLSMQGNVPQIRMMEVGTDGLNLARSYDVSLNMTFDDPEGFRSYKEHPFHKGVAEYVHAVIEASVSCDFEVDA